MKNNMYNKIVGNFGESVVITYLEKLNYEILAKNYYTKFGEIDIVAKDKDEYVFIEVKTRTSEKFGMPSESVNKNKISHIVKASEFYIYINKLENKFIRYDIIEVYFINKNKYYINHLRNNLY